MTRTNKTSGPADGAAVSLDEPLLDCQSAAALLNVRVSWVRDAARQGHLPCLRVGRHLRFTRAMLEDWLAEQVAGRGDTDRAANRRSHRARVRFGLLHLTADPFPAGICWSNRASRLRRSRGGSDPMTQRDRSDVG
jgi:excisionase family DNA binding protein